MRCSTCGLESPPGAACAHCGASFRDAETTILPGITSHATDETARPGLRTAASSPRTSTLTQSGTTLAPGQQFGRYHIMRLLGSGGMGSVYHAWDDELAVAVALKIVRPDTRADPATREETERRLKQETVLARQVTHTNVLRIQDLGEIDGLKYISMPYVEGSDLDKILDKSGHLPVSRALGYARQIADGLVAAHKAGVVHRDLKPANAIVDRDDHLYL